MPVLQRPGVKIHVLKGKELSDEIKDIVKKQGFDLSLANIEQTKAILRSLSSSLSEEIVKTRESNGSTD